MDITLQIKDNITPALAKLTSEVQKKAVMEAAGLAFVSLTQRAFLTASVRPAAWAPRVGGGSHPLLKKSGTLERSIALTSVTPTSATVTSDRIYAAIHQFGGTIKPKSPGGSLRFKMPGGGWVNKKSVTIPARPFFPVTSGGQLTPKALSQIAQAIDRKLESIAKSI